MAMLVELSNDAEKDVFPATRIDHVKCPEVYSTRPAVEWKRLEMVLYASAGAFKRAYR